MHQKGQFIYSVLQASLPSFAGGVALRQEALQSDLIASLGDRGFQDLKSDLEQRLSYLGCALATGRSELFEQHLAFLKVAYVARQAPLELLQGNLAAIDEELSELLSPDHAQMVSDYVDRARTALEQTPDESSSFLESDDHLGQLAQQLLLALLELRRGEAIDMVEREANSGTPLDQLYLRVVTPVQHEVGRLWQINKLRVSEEHYVSRAVEEILIRLRRFHDQQPDNGRTALLTSIGGDQHSIGIKMVASYLEAAGWRTIELGADTPGREIVESAEAFEIDLLALGANLALHLIPAAACIAQIRQVSTVASLPILVGGRPFNAVPDLWKVVGADGCAHSGAHAAEIALQLTDRPVA